MTLPYPRLWGMPPELYETKFLPITAAEVAAGDGAEGQSYRVSGGPDDGALLLFTSGYGIEQASFRWHAWPQAEYEAS